MDKKIPEKALEGLAPVPIHISQQTTPAGETYYKATVRHRDTIGIEKIINRIVAKRTELRASTLLNAYQMVCDEIYSALEDGFNVDFGLGRTDLSVGGTFVNTGDDFDPDRHTFSFHLRPSPRLMQLAEHLKGDNFNGPQRAPRPATIRPAMPEQWPVDKKLGKALPYGCPSFEVEGDQLKVMGDHPDTGLTLRRLDDNSVLPASDFFLYINHPTRLVIVLRTPLERGEWELIISTQYTPTYHFYREPRSGKLRFTVF